MVKDVIYNKMASIERCVKRIQEVYDHTPESLQDDTKQDSIILNIQRACECSLQLANHIVSEKKLSVSENKTDAFDKLAEEEIISKTLADKMKAIVRFRDISSHNDGNVDTKVIQMIIENHLEDFHEYMLAINDINKTNPL